MTKEKPMINLIMLGRTNYGKSTLCGRLCVDLGAVPKEEFMRIKKHAAALDKKGMEFAFIMDKTLIERQRGITIEIGYTGLETKSKKINLMDPPGHVEFIRNLIAGVANAEVAALVLDVEEFNKKGIDKQIEEHLKIASIFGLNQLLVLINKMDLISYSEKVYNLTKEKIIKLLGKAGYSNANSLTYIPITALNGENVLERSKNMPWYKGETFIEALDNFKEPERMLNDPLRVPILRAYSIPDIGIVTAGKIQSGKIALGDKIIICPSFGMPVTATIASIEWQHRVVNSAEHGMDVGIAFKNISPTFNKRNIKKGYVLTNIKNPLKPVKKFWAELLVLDHPTEIKAGYIPLLYCQQARLPCKILKIESKSGTLKKEEKAIVEIEPLKSFVAETEKVLPALGRFILREGDTTIAAGKIIKIEH